jgi:gas vesicle protein
MSNSEGNLLSFITGIALGALAGTAIGILVAPEKGEKTREKLASKSSQLKDELESQVEVGKDKIERFANSVIKQMQNTINKTEADVKES